MGLFKDLLADCFNGLTLQIPKTIVELHVEKKIAERLLPNLSIKAPEDQRWDKIKLGMSEEQVGQLLGLPDGIAERYWGVWGYSRRKILTGEKLDGSVAFKEEGVSSFHLFYKKRDGSWVAGEAPPTAWLQQRQIECRNGEPGTIL